MLDILRAALKGGFKTSEFWLAVLALVVPMLAPLVDKLTGAAQAPGAPVWLALLGAVVASAYAWARAHVKGKTVAAAADAQAGAQLQELGKVVTAIAAGPVAAPAGAVPTRPETGGRFIPPDVAPIPGIPQR